jgi:hypothetical protein
MSEAPVVTLVIPDPSALSWLDRAWMRIMEADRYRREHDTREPVGVDIFKESDHARS